MILKKEQDLDSIKTMEEKKNALAQRERFMTLEIR